MIAAWSLQSEGDRFTRGACGLNDVVLKNRGVSSAELGPHPKQRREITATGIEALTVMPTFKTR